MATAKKAAKKTAGKKQKPAPSKPLVSDPVNLKGKKLEHDIVRADDGTGITEMRPAAKSPAQKPAKLSKYPPALYKVGTPVKIKGDETGRTWHIAGINRENYALEFRHNLPSMQSTRHVAFGDVTEVED
jgi:hypothetical protein